MEQKPRVVPEEAIARDIFFSSKKRKRRKKKSLSLFKNENYNNDRIVVVVLSKAVFGFWGFLNYISKARKRRTWRNGKDIVGTRLKIIWLQ